MPGPVSPCPTCLNQRNVTKYFFASFAISSLFFFNQPLSISAFSNFRPLNPQIRIKTNKHIPGVAPRSCGLRAPCCPDSFFRQNIVASWLAKSTDNSKSNDDNNENHRESDGTRGENDKYKANPAFSSRRPQWALPWMPTWLITMRPAVQFVVGLGFYVLHLTVLTQRGLPFPVQLIPNDRGQLQSIGLDSLAGMLSFAFLIYLRRATKDRTVPAIPPIWSDPTRKEAPWRFPRKKKTEVNSRINSKKSKQRKPALAPRFTSLIAFVLLTATYFSTGRSALFFEVGLYALAGMGLPITIAMHRSLVVLLSHLTWVGAGSLILSLVLKPQPFFGGGSWDRASRGEPIIEQDGDSVGYEQSSMSKRKWKWYTNKWDTYWLWWTVGGYFVSSWLFNVADFFNQLILPESVFEMAGEGVVSQLINPENNDLVASLVGYIAPCLTAPWWEEVLYRGFMLPCLCLHMKFWPAVLLSGVIFSAHHVSLTAAVPLAMLGWTWAALYAKSGNILVTILIHAMWNSRVFLGSWLGI